MVKKNFVILLLLFGTIFVLNVFNIRICPIFNIFHIPCPGCGMTRALILILKGDIVESFKYNILTFPLLIFSIVYIFFGYLRKIVLLMI